MPVIMEILKNIGFLTSGYKDDFTVLLINSLHRNILLNAAQIFMNREITIS
jgi:hypothetical protein